MKALLLLASASLITLLNAAHVYQEKNIHVVSSHPIYSKTEMSRKDHDSRHHKRDYYNIKHRKHIVGYNNIGYYKGMRIVKESHKRLHHFPIEITIRF